MKNKNLLGAFILGAFAGAAIGLLFTTEEGYLTRQLIAEKGKRLANKGKELADSLKEKYHDMMDEYVDKYDSVEDHLSAAGDEISSAFTSAKEQLSEEIRTLDKKI